MCSLVVAVLHVLRVVNVTTADLPVSPSDSLQLVIASLVKVEVAGKSRWDGAT